MIANKPVKGLEELEVRLGKIDFLVPTIVINELNKLASSRGMKRAKEARLALDLVNKFKKVKLDGMVADEAIIDYVTRKRCMAATIDDEMKKRLKRDGINVITLSNNKLVVV